ncbi:flap endonuclease-1 [Candidatus Woesearchaeota archaeon]|nr:flap endonuclease-1 [Candidatus Woesearchaeota archaeon]
MGVNLRDLLIRREIALSDLSGKIIAIDAFNILFQFLSSIRTSDGQLLMDSKGHVTSHLIGVFSRVSRLLVEGITPVFVFDGKPPVLKHEERQKRREQKAEAQRKYEEAVEAGDAEAMKKFASRTSYLSAEMIADAKQVLRLLGVAVVQAPGEGEAQAAVLASQNRVWAVGSQDYDSLLYGTPRLVQNLSIAGKRKKMGKLGTVTVKPLCIDLEENLKKLGVSREQLIVVAMLVGTDYVPGGIKGLGPKKALKLVQESSSIDEVFKAVNWDEHVDVKWTEVFELFVAPNVESPVEIVTPPFCPKELREFLVCDRSFSEQRVDKTLNELSAVRKKKEQSSLDSFL